MLELAPYSRFSSLYTACATNLLVLLFAAILSTGRFRDKVSDNMRRIDSEGIMQLTKSSSGTQVRSFSHNWKWKYFPTTCTSRSLQWQSNSINDWLLSTVKFKHYNILTNSDHPSKHIRVSNQIVLLIICLSFGYSWICAQFLELWF